MSVSSHLKRYGPLVLAALLGLGVRLLPAGQSLGGDDGVSLYYCGKDWATMFQRMAVSGEPNPPLYFMWLHAWLLALGPHLAMSEVWLRMASIVWGVLTIPVVWAVAGEALGETEANIAALFMAVCSFHVEFCEELRMYAMPTLWAALAMWGVWRLPQDGGWRYALGAVLCVYTHYLTGFLLLGLHLIVLLKRDYPWKRLLLMDLVATVAFAPWLPHVLAQSGDSAYFGLRGLPPGAWFPEVLWQLSFGWAWPLPLAGWGHQGLAPVKWVGVAVLAGAICLGLRRRKEADGIVAAWLGGAMAFSLFSIWGISRFTHERIFEYKYFCMLTPCLAVLVGWALPRLRKPFGWAMAVVLFGMNLYSLSLLSFDPALGQADWRGACQYLAKEVGAGDEILAQPGMYAGVMSYYLSQYRLPQGVRLNPTNEMPQDTVVAKHVWTCVAPYHPMALQHSTDAWLEHAGYRAGSLPPVEYGNFFPANAIRVQDWQR
ncbi:MAG TPA: glycosyltransferase family 39 protein [Candidatus Xenobia bacterium]